MAKSKVTICPPAEQDVFFQEQQFDESLGGTNPIRWWQGKISPLQKLKKAPGYGRRVKKDRIDKAETALKGHENKAEILKILKGGLHD